MSQTTAPRKLSRPPELGPDTSPEAEELRRELGAYLRKLEECTDPPMSYAEIQAEIDAVRAERRAALERLGDYLDDLEGDTTPAMSHEEIQEEIRAVRAERRASGAPGPR